MALAGFAAHRACGRGPAKAMTTTAISIYNRYAYQNGEKGICVTDALV